MIRNKIFKNLIIAILGFSILTFVSGCVSIKKDPQSYAVIVKMAANLGANRIITTYGENGKAYLTLVSLAIRTFAINDVLDPIGLTKALQEIPVKELKGEEIRDFLPIVLATYDLVYGKYAKGLIGEKHEIALILVKALEDGIDSAL